MIIAQPAVVERFQPRALHIQKAAADGGALFNEEKIVGRENHNGLAIDILRPFERLTVASYLKTPRQAVLYPDPAAFPFFLKGPLQGKIFTTKTQQIGFPVGPEGTRYSQVVDRLQEIGFPLGIEPGKYIDPPMKGELFLKIVAKVDQF